MNRFLKDLLLYYRFRKRRVVEHSKYVVLFERGLFSDYFDWIVKSVPQEMDIIELQPRPFFVNKRPTLDYCKDLLLKYELIFFHSPGESLQHKCVCDLNKLGMKDNSIGFQHGLIGENPPAGLSRVLRRVRAKLYISFESSFSKCLKKYSSINITEFLLPEPSYSEKFDLPDMFDCYFDAPDKGTIFKNALQLRRFLKSNNSFISNFFFHPSTSYFKKKIIKILLSKNYIKNSKVDTDSVICWDSKIKYELFKDGKDVYKFSDENLRIMNLTHESYDFEKHVQDSLRSFFNKS